MASLSSIGAANRVAPRTTPNRSGIDLARRDSGVPAGQDAGRRAKLGVAGHDLQGLALRQILGCFEIFDHAGDADRHPPSVEQRDAAHAASAATERLPECVAADADGTDNADAGDDHVSEGHSRRAYRFFSNPHRWIISSQPGVRLRNFSAITPFSETVADLSFLEKMPNFFLR